MSRKISQTNISAYFSQPIRGDFHLYRFANTLLLPRVLRRYDKCLTGICTRGEARFTLLGMKRVIKHALIPVYHSGRLFRMRQRHRGVSRAIASLKCHNHRIHPMRIPIGRLCPSITLERVRTKSLYLI